MHFPPPTQGFRILPVHYLQFLCVPCPLPLGPKAPDECTGPLYHIRHHSREPGAKWLQPISDEEHITDTLN